MKKIIRNLACIAVLAGVMLTGCQPPKSKVQKAQENLENATDDLAKAKLNLDRDLEDSIREFKIISDAKIQEHEKSIAEFKARIDVKKLANRVEYEKELERLEKQNSDMQKKLADYKEEGLDKWNAFKGNFNNDMVDLGKSTQAFMENKD